MVERKVILYIACSLDGFIAGPDGDLEFLSSVEKAGEDYGYSRFIESIDTVIMGRKTYDKVLSFGIPYPHADKMSFILTRQSLAPLPGIEFYSGNVVGLIEDLRKVDGKNIFLDGGAEAVAEFLKHGLIDEMVISQVPQILGTGVRLFKEGIPVSNWACISTKLFDTGLVQSHYILKEYSR